MYEGCIQCNESHQDKEVDPAGPYLICPTCGHKQKFQRLPLFTITGACGAGKSTVLYRIMEIEDKPDLVYLESDILLIRGISDSGWDAYRNIWAWLCFNLTQSGHPVALFGGGNPLEYESVSRRQYFSAMHHLVLTCSQEKLEKRLRGRPDWRKASSPDFDAFVRQQIVWNQGLADNASNQGLHYTLLDTTEKSEEQSASEVIAWIAHALAH